jgi:hypothetical protein
MGQPTGTMRRLRVTCDSWLAAGLPFESSKIDVRFPNPLTTERLSLKRRRHACRYSLTTACQAVVPQFRGVGGITDTICYLLALDDVF